MGIIKKKQRILKVILCLFSNVYIEAPSGSFRTTNVGSFKVI